MRKSDIKAFSYFITRTGMYVCPVDKGNIVSFLHGYETGANKKCDFTDLIRLKLETKYRTAYRADGWPGQIERYAEKRNLDWLQAFVFIASEVLNDEINKSNKKSTQQTAAAGRGQ